MPSWTDLLYVAGACVAYCLVTLVLLRALVLWDVWLIKHNRAKDLKPYKSTPVFDADTLPAGLQREHRTKAGVWGIIRVKEGKLRLRFLEPMSETILDPQSPGLILPDQPHLVEPLGPMRMHVEFYDQNPRTQLAMHKSSRRNSDDRVGA